MLDGAIPWASGAVYMSGVLGVSAFEYVPWMVFNYSSVFIGLACAMLGIGIVKISAEDAKERLEKGHSAKGTSGQEAPKQEKGLLKKALKLFKK